MNNNNIIKNSYSYFDSKAESNETNLKFSKINKWKELDQGSDIKRPIMRFFDDNGNNLFDAEYEIIGTQYPVDNKEILWVWGWAHPQLNKNQTMLCRNLLSYGLDITNTESYIDMFLKSIFTNSRLKISDNELELLIAISLYLTKKEGVITLNLEEKGITYSYWLIITKINK